MNSIAKIFCRCAPRPPPGHVAPGTQTHLKAAPARGLQSLTLARGFARRMLAVIVVALATLTQPGFAQPAPLVLDTDAQAVLLAPALELFLDESGELTVDKLEQLPAERFKPAVRHTPYNVENGALWLRFDATVRNPAYNGRLTVPMPGIDDVRLYYRNASGQWVRQQAGDSVRMSLWPQPGRYPTFLLNYEVNQPTRYYVEIRPERVPFSMLPEILSTSQFITTQQKAAMLLGIFFGLAALVITLALVNAVAYRDAGFGSYAVYMTLFAGSQATFSGVAGLYLWPELPAINNFIGLTLPASAASAALMFVRTVITPRRFSRALDWLLLAMAGLLPMVGLFDMFGPTIENFVLINSLIILGMLVMLMVIGVAIVEGNRHARWIAFGFLPVLLATAFPVARNLGLINTSFLTEYGRMLASAISAPLLFYGLLTRLSQQREPSARATSLRTKDPLTGLYTTPVLVNKLRQSLGTAGRYPQPFALLVINFTNLALLQSQHGREAGDRAMVVAAARLRLVARPVDTVARVGDSQFAMLIEGPVSQLEANDLATKILASGLRPSNEVPDAEPIRFHIAVGHLDDPKSVAPGDAAACFARMQQSVKDLNDGSPKAIRLVKL